MLVFFIYNWDGLGVGGSILINYIICLGATTQDKVLFKTTPQQQQHHSNDTTTLAPFEMS